MYQVTLTVWFDVTLNALGFPATSENGDGGLDVIITGPPPGAVTLQSHVCVAVPLTSVAMAVTFQLPRAALVLVYVAAVTFALV